MTIHLVRHAKAGNRSEWSAPDQLRPLDAEGKRQAKRLAKLHASSGTERILSSPYVRCVQTVDPLAARLGLPVISEDALAEGASFEEVIALYRREADRTVVMCTHGDVVEMTLDRLVHDDVPIEGPLRLKKGSTWVLELKEGEFASARYLAPPG